MSSESDTPHLDPDVQTIRHRVIAEIDEIVAPRDAVTKSRIGEAGRIKSQGGDGVHKSIVGSVEEIHIDESISPAGIRDSWVGDVGTIESECYGIRDSYVESVDEIHAKFPIGINLPSEDSPEEAEEVYVGSVGTITGRYGIRQADVESIGILNTTKTAVRHSQIGHIDSILTKEKGIVESHVDHVESIQSNSFGVSKSSINRLGSVEADAGVARSSIIDVVDGDVETNGIVFYNCDIGEIYGNIVSERTKKVGGYFQRNPDDHRQSLLNNVTEPETWFGGESTQRSTIFHRTDLPYAVVDEIRGKKLDSKSYGGFIAAENIEIEESNDRMFVLTPDDTDQFTTYNGDWDELTEFLENQDDLLKGLSVFQPEVDQIEDIEELQELNDKYTDLIDDIELEDIKDSFRYIYSFRDLDDKYFGQVVRKAADTLETADLEQVENFAEMFTSLPQDVQDTIIDGLQTEDIDNVGYDLFNIGKKQKYSQMTEDDPYEMVKLLDGGNRLIDQLENAPVSNLVENIVKDTYISLRDGRLSGLMTFLGSREDYGGLPAIDDEVFEDDSPYATILEHTIDQFEDEIKFVSYLAEAAGHEYDPDYGLKSKEGRRQHDPNFTLDDEDFEGLIQHINKEATKDIDSKQRAYLIDALQNLGEAIARREYKEAVGKEPDQEEFSEDEIAALKAHASYSKNKELIGHILDPETTPTDLEDNKEWLEQKGLEYEEIAGFGSEEYDVNASGSLEATIKEKQEDLLAEMNDLINEFGDYQISSIQDVEEKRDEIERPSSGDKQEIYDELFKEKVDEYHGINDQVEGIPETVEIRPAEPLEAMQMGNYFTNSCLAIGKTNGWSAAANAYDANKQVILAEDEEGDVVGRVLTAITEKGRLVDYKLYNNSEADLDEHMDEYIDAYAEHLGLERVPDEERTKNVETLVADEWYSKAIY